MDSSAKRPDEPSSPPPPPRPLSMPPPPRLPRPPGDLPGPDPSKPRRFTLPVHPAARVFQATLVRSLWLGAAARARAGGRQGPAPHARWACRRRMQGAGACAARRQETAARGEGRGRGEKGAGRRDREEGRQRRGPRAARLQLARRLSMSGVLMRTAFCASLAST